MGTYTQENRLIKLTTPLGKDVLLLQAFQGQEGVSRLFHFDLMMHSENRAISFEEVVGKKATIHIALPDGSERYINGIVSAFSQGGSSVTFAHYHATLVPWLWMLTRTSDCRIFQKMTVPDIIQKIFNEYGFADFKNRLHGHFPEREYCVQYRETDFNFVSRLMEEEGICYFFEHEKEKHTLVLADQPTEFKPSPYQGEARYAAADAALHLGDVVTEWSVAQEVRPGKYEVKDYNFEKPSLDLTASVTGKDKRKYEIYDYPGEYMAKDQGESLVGIRMQEEESAQVVVKGSGTCRGFSTGYRFELKEHYRRNFNKAYVLLSIYHSANQGDNYQSSNGDGARSFDYVNHFQCVPYPTPFRPPRTTPVPVVHGTQTAVVVGPKGEEIYTDKYGRVKAQFHWDREGKRDEQSSCWIRVSQPWAGKNWGTVSIPRIGQEVIVDFLEGDPDQPIIVGRVYNAEQMPPFTLPAGGVVSGIKSNSTKGGGGYNELSMNDTKGKEMVTLHGQYDMSTVIEHDDTQHIKNNRTITVDGTHTETIKKDTKITISAGTFTHDVAANTAKYHVKSALTEDYDATQTTTVANEIVITSKGSSVHITAATEIQLEVGASKLLMKSDGSIELTGLNVGVKGAAQVNIKGGQVNSEADSNHNTKGAIVVSEGSASNTVKGGMVMLNP